MLRRSLALLAAASTLALPALAWDDPIANEIQSRMMEQQQKSIDEFVADQQAWGGEDDEDYAYEEPPAYSEEEWMAWSSEGDSAAACPASKRQCRGVSPQRATTTNNEQNPTTDFRMLHFRSLSDRRSIPRHRRAHNPR